VIRALPLVLLVGMALALVSWLLRATRRNVASTAFSVRRLSAERGLPIFDAAVTGYPPRMRRRPEPAD
jgi:hypothetical protein